MANDVLMPKMGYDMTEGRILRWLKQEGEPVERGQALAEIETDKATIEIEAFATGTLGQIIGKEGDTVPVGQRIAVILGEGESAPAAPANGAAAKPEAKAEPKAEAKAEAQPEAKASGESAQPQPVIPNEGQRTVAGAEAVASQEAAPADSGDRIKASPIARRIAQEHEIDLRQVAASGPGGRIVREDVEAFLRDRQSQPAAVAAPAAPAAAPAPTPAAPAPAAAPAGEGQQVPLTRMRQAIARTMVASKTTIPHFYVSAEVDMTEALAWRKRLNDAAAADGFKISVNDMVLKACAAALVKFPNVNASFGGDHILLHDHVNISIAVAVKEGLISPVLHNVEQKSIGQIARETADMVGRAREGKLRADEYSGGTFTVSNLGPFNVTEFIAIITPPQAAALAVASSIQKAVVVDGQIAIRDRMTITISADHRVTDGAEAAQFVGEVRRLLENPSPC
ncbi:MAG: dihydrolipoamide acetyltransferase family protein [Chloroflexia bacterium]